MILSIKLIAKALISLHGYTGWSLHLSMLLAKPENRVSCVDAHFKRITQVPLASIKRHKQIPASTQRRAINGPTSDRPLRWHIAGRPLVVRRCVLFGMSK